MKLARVNLEAESFGDPRFAFLARLLGLPNADGHFALVKVALVWSWQTENYDPALPIERRFVVPVDVIEMALGPDGVVHLVRARLAEETPDGVRMRGANDERTGWLWRLRKKSQAGGEASATTRRNRKTAHASQPVVEHGQAVGPSTGAAQESPLSSSLSVPDPDLSRTTSGRGDAGGSYDPQADSHSASDVAEPFGVLGEHAVARLNAARSKIDPTARAIHPMSAANGGDGARLRQRLREVAPASERRSVLDHVLDVVIATAEGERSVAKLSLVYISGEQAWPSLRDATLASIAARLGPRDRDRSPAQARPGRVDANSRLDEQLDRVQRLRDAEAAEGSPS